MMGSQESFHSPLADVMGDFVAFKRMQGYDYCSRVKDLKHFDRFMINEDCLDGFLRREHFERYLQAYADCSLSRRHLLISAVRQFSRYLHARRPGSAVVPTGVLPRCRRRVRFCRISPEQVRALMDASETLLKRRPVKTKVVPFMIGLMYSTGLRVNEALELNLDNIDLENGTIFVRRGKFSKDRIVALDKSVIHALEEWLKQRTRYTGTQQSGPLLIGNAAGKRLTYEQVVRTFRKLCQHCGLTDEPPPRLHDLRHNFACHCIARWREAGEDVQALFPILANAMGHVNIFATQIYIHIEVPALHKASTSFLSHVTKHTKDLP